MKPYETNMKIGETDMKVYETNMKPPEIYVKQYETGWNSGISTPLMLFHAVALKRLSFKIGPGIFHPLQMVLQATLL